MRIHLGQKLGSETSSLVSHVKTQLFVSRISLKIVMMPNNIMRFLIFCFYFVSCEIDWWDVDHKIYESGKTFKAVQSAPVFQVSLGADFPFPIQPANNNVGIAIYSGRIFIGFRTSKSHFASEITQMIIASAPWTGENQTTFDWKSGD